MAAVMLVSFLLAGCSGNTSEPKAPPAPTSPPQVAPPGELVSEPMRVARAWTTALAPNKRGGWNFITQTYEYESKTPTEFVVLDLLTGKQSVFEGPAAVYANSNYQVAEQLRAANGRIFFPEINNQIAYYDPTDESVNQVGKLDNGSGDKLVFRVVFGPDGQLYAGTQSNGLPTIFQLDPDTLQYTVLGKVGRDRISYSYAYYLAVDPPWVYVAVGQTPWELAALNIETGEMRILATRKNEGFMQFDLRKEGITAKLISGLRTPEQKTDLVWCADGKIFPVEPGKKLPFRPRTVAPKGNPIAHPPQLDLADLDPGTDGTGLVRWRSEGSTDAWRETVFRVKYTTPVDIDSLVALPDGSLLGSTKQYHGFFRYNPKDRTTRRYRSLGISGGPRAVLGGKMYFAGYPNGVLYAYDPEKPWTASKQTAKNANPEEVGNFAAAGAHYAYFLAPAPNGRLYFAGRRERDGVGGGIGYYEPSTGRFAGHHDNLNELDPQGFVVLDALKLIAYSGRSNSKTPAQLVMFDFDLKEQERQTVIPGLTDTGQLFPTRTKNILLGVSKSEHVLYRHDVSSATMLDFKELPGDVAALVQNPKDYAIWMVIESRLWRFDPETLVGKEVRDLPATPTGATGLLEWQGDRLFWATASQLREVVTPDGK